MRRSVLLVLVLVITFSGTVFAEDYKSAVKKVQDQLYDPRKEGLKTLSFEMRFDPPRLVELQSKAASATAYWQSSKQHNFQLRGSSGKPLATHPFMNWVLYHEYVEKSMPLGPVDSSLMTILSAKNGKVERTKTGYTITGERDVKPEGRAVVHLKSVCLCDPGFRPLKVMEYGLAASQKPPAGQPNRTTTYQVLGNGKSAFTGSKWYKMGGGVSVSYAKTGKYWFPAKFVNDDYQPTTVTFSKYKINPRLSKSDLTPPKWPTAKISLSSPDKTLRSFHDALYLGDLKGIRDCLAKDSRAQWDKDVDMFRGRTKDFPKAALSYDPDIAWSCFIHANAGKTSKIILTDKKQTSTTYSAHLKTVTTGRPVEYTVKLVREGRAWKVANLPDEFMKGYD